MITDKAKPHAIFLDIDGTLMKHGRPVEKERETIPEYNIQMINKARAAGHKVFINTGRGYAFLPPALFEDVTFDGMITGNGSNIIVGDRTIFNCPISKEILEEILSFILENKKPCRFQGIKTRIAYDPKVDLSPVWTHISSTDEFCEKLGDDFVSKITIDRELEGEYYDLINSRLHLYCREHFGEAAMHGCTKATGIKRVLDYVGIPRERSIAMGDSINDTEMLSYAAISVATDNAADSIKKMCTFVTASELDGGVGKAIEKLLF